MLYLLDLFGVAVFAITGSLAAGQKAMDLFGVVVVALVTALGGGTLRDLMLGRAPVFWVNDTLYLIVVVITSLLTFWLTRMRPPTGQTLRRALLVADAFGLAIFTVLGARITLESGANALIACIMGVMTGVAGGVIRDLLANQIPLILRSEIYAVASLCGAVVYVLLLALQLDAAQATIPAVLTTLVLRLVAIRRRWSLPRFMVEP